MPGELEAVDFAGASFYLPSRGNTSWRLNVFICAADEYHGEKIVPV